MSNSGDYLARIRETFLDNYFDYFFPQEDNKCALEITEHE